MGGFGIASRKKKKKKKQRKKKKNNKIKNKRKKKEKKAKKTIDKIVMIYSVCKDVLIFLTFFYKRF